MRDSLDREHSSLFKQAHSLALAVIAHDLFCLFAGRFRVYHLVCFDPGVERVI